MKKYPWQGEEKEKEVAERGGEENIGGGTADK